MPYDFVSFAPGGKLLQIFKFKESSLIEKGFLFYLSLFTHDFLILLKDFAISKQSL